MLTNAIEAICSYLQSLWKRLTVDAPSRDVPSLSVFLPLLTQTFHTLQQLMSYNVIRHNTVNVHYTSPCDVHAMTSRRDVTWRYDVMWRHDITVWHHMTSYVMTVSLHGPSHQKCRKFTFSNMATLTFDLWPWPSNSSKILSRSTYPQNFGSVCHSVHPWERWLTDRHTDAQTHRTDFIPSTADAGGKDIKC